MAGKPGVRDQPQKTRAKLKDAADPEQRLPRGAESIASAEGRAPKGSGAGKTKAQVHTWLFNGRDPGSDFELSTLPRLITNSKNLAWVDVCRYSEDELRDLAQLLGLHSIGVDAALAPWQRPRVDTFADSFFLTVTVVKPAPGKLTVEVGELDLFVGENFLLTLHKEELPFLESIAERVYRSPDLVRYHTAYVVYIVLDEMLDFYQNLFEDLEEWIEHIEEHALTDNSDTFLGDLLRLKRYVFLIGRLAEQNRVVFSAITRPDFQFISGPDLEPYFRDLQQRLEQTVERLFAARDAVNSAFDIYVSQMSHRTNNTMKLLAVVSTVLLPATLITGIFGTNFAVPLLHSEAALALMVGALLIVPVAVVIALRANKVL
ncbi:MAG TPA: magnesium transporter CorA family protein [Candidatus Dormibacteraeota bacterium]